MSENGRQAFTLFDTFREFNDMFGVDLLPTERTFARSAFLKKGDTFQLQVEAPGFTDEEIDIGIVDRGLRVKGKSSSTGVTRSLNAIYRIPVTADTENVSAKLKNGILTIEIPTRSKETKVKIT